MVNRAVFFDRDGVINEAIVRNGKPYPPSTQNEFRFSEGIAELLNELERQGFLRIIFTNQPDVARGTQTKDQVEKFHQWIHQHLPITKIYTCFHDDSDQCHCRKPSPGMIFQAKAEFSIDLQQSFVVGDRWKDIEAGRRAECQTIWLNHHYSEPFNSQTHFEVLKIQEIGSIIANIVQGQT